jgi:hypothetical protein
LQQAVLVDCDKGRNKMLFESCNRAFGGVDPVIVGWDEVDVHMVASDVCFDCLGAFIVHNVERGGIPAGIEVGKNVREHCNHGTIGFARHGVDKDGIQVVDICHKHILHVAEGLHGEGTGAIGVHCLDV